MKSYLVKSKFNNYLQFWQGSVKSILKIQHVSPCPAILKSTGARAPYGAGRRL